MAEAAGTDAGQAEERVKARQGRVIVRNLIFDMREQHLKKAFGRFGKIEAVDVPLNNSNNQNRGFGFIEFSAKNEALAAIAAMHESLFKGRKITVEFSLPKASYETKVQHVLDNTNQTKQQVTQPKSIKFDPKPEPVLKAVRERTPRAKEAPDSKDETTLFVRNVAWDVTQAQFREHMEQFGQVHYAVLCKAAGDMQVA